MEDLSKASVMSSNMCWTLMKTWSPLMLRVHGFRLGACNYVSGVSCGAKYYSSGLSTCIAISGSASSCNSQHTLTSP